MSFQSFFHASWFEFLEDEGKVLVTQSVELVERESRLNSSFHDYSFLVFPMAKAYESFLKKLLFAMGLIDRNQYEGKQFRIGRSLNPDIPSRHRDEYWLYDNVAGLCGGELARDLWNTWLSCRNHIFHYFPEEKSNISLSDAQKLLRMMDTSMDAAFMCMSRKK